MKIFTLLLIYLIGAFPTGYLLARRKGVNLAQHGSGNVGATNVSRVLGKRAGLITLGVDLLKGILAMGLANYISPTPGFLGVCAVGVVAGHCFSLPPILRGGKGVATASGAIIYLDPILFAFCLIVFLIAIASARMVSLASILSLTTLPIIAILLSRPNGLIEAYFVLAAIVIFRHRSNIARIAMHQEIKLKSLIGTIPAQLQANQEQSKT